MSEASNTALPRFSLRQVQYFIAVGETGSISTAAQQLHISAPSISMAISHLEEEFGTKLFVRQHGQGLSLTKSGRAVLAEAKRLVSQAHEVALVAANVAGSVRGPITIGCLWHLAPLLIPELVQSFTAAFPGAGVNHFVANHERLLAALLSAEIDVALTYDLGMPTGVDFLALARLPPQALVGEGHPLAGRSKVTFKQLAKENLLLFDVPPTRDYHLSLFSRAGVEPRIGIRLAYPDVIRTMVANNYGYTILSAIPRMQTALDGRRVIHVPIAGNHPPTVLGLATIQDDKPPRLVSAFIKHCRDSISDSKIPGVEAPGSKPRKTV